MTHSQDGATMRLVHVLLLAETLPDAERIASAWRAAAPHAGTDVREVRVPNAVESSAGGPGPGAGPGAAGGGGVLLAGAAIPVGRPDTVGPHSAGPAHPGPTPPGPASSALPRAEGAALADAVARADVVVAYVTRLDGAGLHRGVVVEAAAAAAPHAVPVVVVTERSEVSRREWSTAGLSGVHEVADGDVARVARTWTPAWTR